MKKTWIALLLAAVMVVSLAACAKAPAEEENTTENAETTTENAETTDETEETTTVEDETIEIETGDVDDPSIEIVGGWTFNQEDMSAELKGIQKEFDEACSDLDGAVLKPVTILGSQVVSGFRYAILCQSTPVTPNAATSLCVVVLQIGVNGTKEIVKSAPIDLGEYANKESTGTSPVELAAGGWSFESDYTPAGFSKEAQAAYDKTVGSLDGVAYTPIAMLGTQVTAGINYAFLCCQTLQTEESTYEALCLAFVYDGVDGNAEVSSIVNFNISDLLAD